MTNPISKIQPPTPDAGAAGISRDGRFDEATLAPRAAAELYSQLRTELERAGASNLSRLSQQSQRLMRDLGVTFNLYREDAAAENILPFDPFPRVLDRATWDHLARGLAQRVRGVE